MAPGVNPFVRNPLAFAKHFWPNGFSHGFSNISTEEKGTEGKIEAETNQHRTSFERICIMAKVKASELVNRISDVEANGEEMSNMPSMMQLEIVTFYIQGISPLLQNNPAEFIGNKEDEGISLAKKTYDDEEEARLRLYKDPEGQHCHPAECFTKAMVKAAAGKKIGKNHLTNLLKAGVFLAEPFCILEDKHGKPLTRYGIDRRSVVIGKSRVLRCRPCWPAPWFMRVALEVDMAILSEKAVKEILSLAGRFPGIGDYRPEKGGAFGRFKVI
jgi:hypothetical protein